MGPGCCPSCSGQAEKDDKGLHVWITSGEAERFFSQTRVVVLKLTALEGGWTGCPAEIVRILTKDYLENQTLSIICSYSSKICCSYPCLPSIHHSNLTCGSVFGGQVTCSVRRKKNRSRRTCKLYRFYPVPRVLLRKFRAACKKDNATPLETLLNFI